ncbi:MAG TPA: class I SAM-dependent methyltransferase, partial [Terrimicrobiaceae bacterium]|nr:class I SAM-dependent methyltransferase [Terrimicrobiaceae bacterium]
LDENRFWDRYDWSKDGDEWTDQAAFCGTPYPMWKQDVVAAFIVPNVSENSTVLELAMGHGRWTPFLAQRARRYLGVDFGPSCVKFCQIRFAALANATFHLNDGRSIPMIANSSVHFIWSFDSFVHIEPDITSGYMAEFARVLVPGGRCVIHHPGTPTTAQRVQGGRSQLTIELFAQLARANGLEVLSQTDCWGPGDRSNTRLFADCVSTIGKPTTFR